MSEPYSDAYNAMMEQHEPNALELVYKHDGNGFKIEIDPATSRFNNMSNRKTKCMPEKAYRAWFKRQQAMPDRKIKRNKKYPRNYWRGEGFSEHDRGDYGDGIDHHELW